jgi:hypothetical protein
MDTANRPKPSYFSMERKPFGRNVVIVENGQSPYNIIDGLNGQLGSSSRSLSNTIT